MVQISKLTKGELAITGFKNRSIASRFMKQILNKKARDCKDKVELINTLTTKYFEMKNYGIDLNDIAKVERNVKQVDKFVKKSQEEFEQFNFSNKDQNKNLFNKNFLPKQEEAKKAKFIENANKDLEIKKDKETNNDQHKNKKDSSGGFNLFGFIELLIGISLFFRNRH